MLQISLSLSCTLSSCSIGIKSLEPSKRADGMKMGESVNTRKSSASVYGRPSAGDAGGRALVRARAAAVVSYRTTLTSCESFDSGRISWHLFTVLRSIWGGFEVSTTLIVLAHCSLIAGIQSPCFWPFTSTNSVHVITPLVAFHDDSWMICGYEPVTIV
jgi:hypothetical protein